ncbi:SitI3 family protein [Kitasatospora sp. NPDC088783]|uniref:SitI3 family protein n=1 Tax=Kitasatospora sp. NPDC088783 TaxID=3364077 RepID=UPI0038271ACD
MSVNHRIYLDTDESAQQIASRISLLLREKGLISDHLDAEQLLEGGMARMVSGAQIQVSPYEPMPFDVIREKFGISPSIQVRIRPKKEEPSFPQEDDIAILAAALLDGISADMALSYNFETAWLIRRTDGLILHESPSLWPEHRLALIRSPYRRESHHL